MGNFVSMVLFFHWATSLSDPARIETTQSFLSKLLPILSRQCRSGVSLNRHDYNIRQCYQDWICFLTHLSDKFSLLWVHPTRERFFPSFKLSVSAFLFPFQSISVFLYVSFSLSLSPQPFIHIRHYKDNYTNYLQQSNCLQIVSYFSVCIMSNCSTLSSLFIGLTMTERKSEIN